MNYNLLKKWNVAKFMWLFIKKNYFIYDRYIIHLVRNKNRYTIHKFNKG
jgi:hypothetical protein